MERCSNYLPKRPVSPLQWAAIALAGGLFCAWERAYGGLFLGFIFLALKRKFWLLPLLSGAFLYGFASFPPPDLLPQERKLLTLKAWLLTPLQEGPFYKKGQVEILPDKEKGIFYFPKNVFLKPGQKFEALVLLKRSRSNLNPFSPDFARSRKAYELQWIGNVKHLKILTNSSWHPFSSLREGLFRFAETLSPEARGLFEALILGTKANLSSHTKDTFSRMGIFHLLAISGLHLGLLLALISILLRGFFYLFPTLLLRLTFKQWLFLVATPFLIIYALVSGPTPSALRALTMFALWGGALLFWRELSGLDLLALTVLLILLFQPEAVGSFSFRLSVGAVLGILLFRKKFLTIYKGVGVRRYLLESLGYSFAAMLATSPWLLLLRGAVSPWAVISNIVFLPLFALFILPAEFLAAFLSPFAPELASWFAEKAAFITNLPDLSLPQLSPFLPLGVFFLIFFLPLIATFLLGRKGLGAGVLISIALFIFFYRAYQHLQLALILDVGEGSAAIVKAGKEVLLFDAGPRRGNFEAAKSIIIPTLRKLALKPQKLIISHFQSDHAGGLESLKKAYPGLKIYSPRGNEKRLSGAGYQITLWRDPTFSSANNASLVSKIELFGRSILFPGDIERTRERKLLSQDLRADILILPHHGAKTSSSYPFLKKVSPELAISSARSPKHPAPETLKRLKSLGIPHLSTKEHGAISIIFEEKTWVCLEDKRRKEPLFLRALWPYLKTGCYPLPAKP